MKTTKFALIIVLSFAISANLQAQFLDKLAKKAQKTAEKVVEKRTEKRVEKTVNDVFDKTEEGIDKASKSDDKQTSSSSKTKTKKTTTKKETAQTDEISETTQQETVNPTLTWSKYDFVPGAQIIFEDNLAGEQNGEFPSKWDLVSGSVENANFDSQNVIYFIKCNANGGGNIIPMLKNSTSDYLPEEFTIEFDAYYGEKSSNYYVYLSDTKNQAKLDKTMRADDKWLRFSKNGGEYEKDIEIKYYPGFSSTKYDKTSKWRHIAISFNTRALKAYLDDARILNIPNLGYNPTGVSLSYHNPSGTTVGYIKNIRIAKGAVPLYDKILTDGKFVTTGIKFDVNKATIKAESAGTINYVVKMMQDHPELKFSVEGHTDSDGDNASNLALSQKRAEAVKNALIKQGIDAERLTSKGWGETKPMTGNDTPEGKAQNRRVEFVKQ